MVQGGSRDVILSPSASLRTGFAKNLGSIFGRLSGEVDQRCFAKPVLSEVEGLNMTASFEVEMSDEF